MLNIYHFFQLVAQNMFVSKAEIATNMDVFSPSFSIKHGPLGTLVQVVSLYHKKGFSPDTKSSNICGSGLKFSQIYRWLFDATFSKSRKHVSGISWTE